jgi:hypothetical protein
VFLVLALLGGSARLPPHMAGASLVSAAASASSWWPRLLLRTAAAQ